MRLLLTNDDGIDAEGLRALAALLTPIHEVTVVAPREERSASAHSFTMHHILRLTPREMDGVRGAYACSGTPVDCVKMALDLLYDAPPDLIISGINKGENLGTDALYSGTVSAAMEGAIRGVKAVAFSLSVRRDSPDFSLAARISADLAGQLARAEWPTGCMMNVNIPASRPTGLRVTRMGLQCFDDHYIRHTDPRGGDYYWMDGQRLAHAPDEDSDVAWAAKGCITVTPLGFDLTRGDLLPRLSLSWEENHA